MSGRGRPKRAPKRPARLRTATPPPVQRRRQADDRGQRCAQAGREVPASNAAERSGSPARLPQQDVAWWDQPRPVPSIPTPQGTDNDSNSEALLCRIKDLEAVVANQQAVLSSQQATSRGQELDHLAIAVPPELITRIIDGKCIDLSLLLAKSFLDKQEDSQVSYVQDDQGRLLPKQQRKRAALSIEQWTTAYLIFMSVYLSQHPEELQQMLAYIELIRGAARDNPGNAWSLYDLQFRSRKEADPGRSWGMIDTQLWLQLFCKPPQMGASAGYSQTQTQRQAQQQQIARGCYFFQKENGCFRPKCSFVHECNFCHSRAHGAFWCQKGAQPVEPKKAPMAEFGLGRAPFRIGGQGGPRGRRL